MLKLAERKNGSSTCQRCSNIKNKRWPFEHKSQEEQEKTEYQWSWESAGREQVYSAAYVSVRSLFQNKSHHRIKPQAEGLMG